MPPLSPIGGKTVHEYKDARATNARIFHGAIDQSETVIPETRMIRVNAIIQPFGNRLGFKRLP